jgi:hypothetical protein
MIWRKPRGSPDSGAAGNIRAPSTIPTWRFPSLAYAANRISVGLFFDFLRDKHSGSKFLSIKSGRETPAPFIAKVALMLGFWTVNGVDIRNCSTACAAVERDCL